MNYSVKRWSLPHCYMGKHWDNYYSDLVDHSDETIAQGIYESLRE